MGEGLQGASLEASHLPQSQGYKGVCVLRPRNINKHVFIEHLQDTLSVKRNVGGVTNHDLHPLKPLCQVREHDGSTDTSLFVLFHFVLVSPSNQKVDGT